ncbi:unnamed protein product, partial [Vitis vinifera]
MNVLELLRPHRNLKKLIAFLSSFFKTLLDELISSDLLDYARQVQVHAELNKWEKTLKKIHADILDELATEALGRKLMAETQPSTSKFRSLIPSCCTSFTPSAIKVTKTIVQSVASDMSDFNDLNLLQVKLKEKLSGTKFLLVLDDVWNQNCDKWDTLYAPMRTGAQGSRVIVTTRNQGVVSAIGASSAYPLKELSNDECFYHHLPSHLKCCFAYCSIFPKDYEFDVDELVLLWMGEGFLHQVNRQKQMEEIGTEFFHELFARSFFQQSNHSSSQFVMHDLVHDLAQFVAGGVCFNLEEKIENNQQHTICERARHSGFTRQVYEVVGKFKAFDKVKNLRTLILIHLRYLNFSESNIQSLPNSVGHLYNLQTLILRGCRQLTKLPTGIGKLKNLRHLDITELKNCSNLQGVLSISGLQEVVDVGEARAANLKDKKKIEELTMQWSNDCWDARNDKRELRVLESLQPRENLRRLTIAFYGGSKFPSWLGDPSFSVTVELTLKNCKKCTLLPNLGGLSMLKELRFEDMPEWESWSHSNLIKEDSLVELEVLECPGLMCGLPKLASLRELNLKECDEAVLGGAQFDLPSLVTVNLIQISRLACLRTGFTRSLVALQELKIHGCDGLTCLWEEQWLPCNLKKLEIRDCANLEKLSNGLQTLTRLEELEIRSCPKLDNTCCLEDLWIRNCSSLNSFPTGELPSTLKKLTIVRCTNLESVSQKIAPNSLSIPNLEFLEIEGCETLKSLTHQMRNLKSLRSLTISECPGLKSFPEEGMESLASLALHNLISLRFLHIINCPNLRSLGPLPATLAELDIYDCPTIEERYLKEGGEYWSNITLPSLISTRYVQQFKFSHLNFKIVRIFFLIYLISLFSKMFLVYFSFYIIKSYFLLHATLTSKDLIQMKFTC